MVHWHLKLNQTDTQLERTGEGAIRWPSDTVEFQRVLSPLDLL